ncbi:MAG: TIGR04086 family membrane protein [Clostridiales bacterium]|nr:TIGR04086 family membrane protein [Clostridiales bacterium]
MKTEVKTENSRFHSLVSGVLVGYAITCIIFLGYSMLITYTSLTEDKMPLVVAGATLISVIVAGFDAARGAENKGWFWGIVAGLIYALILLIIMTLVLKGFTVDSRTVTVLVLSLAGGGLGGVVGINFRK